MSLKRTQVNRPVVNESMPSAMDAIWNSNFGSEEDKLVMCYLTNRHPVGDRYTARYLPVDQFVSSLQECWSFLDELITGTRLTRAKVERSLANLHSKQLICISQRPARTTKKNKDVSQLPREKAWDITNKLFSEYMAQSATKRTA